MKKFCTRFVSRFLVTAALIVGGVFHLGAITSPYVTTQGNIPLNQSTSDSVNGQLPYFTSHSPVEGSFTSLTDATSASTPQESVICGPDNTWIGMAWDFGIPPAGMMWRLDRIDLWIAGGDNLRRGYRGDFSVSNTGNINDFQIIPNSEHEDDFTQNGQFNYVRYDFPADFVAGSEPNKDKYPVKGFRFLRLNSLGGFVNNVRYQSRFVEVDIWVTPVPIPTTATRNGNDIQIGWTSLPNRSYEVEYKTDLNQPGWGYLQTVVANGESASVSDSLSSSEQRFYRVVLVP